jgi:hypothetical protein
MANEAKLLKGTTLTLGASGTTTSVSNDAFRECTDDTRTVTDDAGYPLGIFSFATGSSGWTSTAPTAGAAIHVFERKLVNGANSAPVIDADYPHDYVCTFNVDVADVQQYFESHPVPINLNGASYYVQWVDGGAGSASMDGGWELKLTPCTYGT